MAMTETTDPLRALAEEMESAVSLSLQLGTPVADRQLVADWSRQLRAALRLAQQGTREQIDNGNIYVFCHAVGEIGSVRGVGCVRGAGHNGPHAFVLPPYPQMPVVLATLRKETVISVGDCR